MFQTPVLFLVFNRLDTTKKVFERIKEIRPKYLYVAADGARESKKGEDKKCQLVREYILNSIDWECEVKTLFREKNLGCGRAVSSAIDWFFENVEQGIILEDDVLPHQNFFNFCEFMLNLYRDDEKIMHLSGTTFLDNSSLIKHQYYLSKHIHVWGWATWKNKWKKYSFTLQMLDEDRVKKAIQSHCFGNQDLYLYWNNIFEQVKNGKIDTWDYQWMFAIWLNNGWAINPKDNVISNIGFGDNATHTTDIGHWSAELPFQIDSDTYSYIPELKYEKKIDIFLNKKIFSHLYISKKQPMIYRVLNKVKRIINKVRNTSNDTIEIPNLSQRYVSGVSDIAGFPIHYVDAPTFFYGYEEIFKDQIYAFKAKSEYPLIIDCGANIGLATIFFKNKYPQARIIAFEPDPNIFKVLNKNISELQLSNVEVFQEAIWINNHGVEFNLEGGFSGRIPYDKEVENNIIKVPTKRLKDLLKEEIDFLKIDIEGAENDVIFDIKDSLGNVNNIFIEYHSYSEKEQRLHEILQILNQNDFRYHIQEAFVREQPFIERNTMLGMDLQLNIYGYRK